MSEETLFKKIRREIHRKGRHFLSVDCIMWRGEKHRCWEIWLHVD